MTARPPLKTGELAWLEVHQLVQHEAFALVVVGPFIGPHLGTAVSFLVPRTRVPLLIVKVSARVAQAPYDTICQSLFGRVLYPTDWSPCASKALDALISLKPLGLSEVIVTHVVAPQEIAHLTSSQRVAHRAQVQQQLAQTQRRLEEADLDVRPVLLEGDPARELVHLSAREDVALIVMGTTGKGMTAEMTLGSVSGAVARTTDRSVLLVCHTAPQPT
jgi:nucleotide-binding universal stress UspA family protein